VNWQAVGGIGAALGGVGAAVSAFFARQAARASKQTRKDALEALAVGISPWLGIESFAVAMGGTGEVRWYMTINNESAWPATHVTLDVRLMNGESIHRSFERIDPPTGDRPDTGERIDLGPAPQNSPPPQLVGRDVTLRYSDGREIARTRRSLGSKVGAIQAAARCCFTGWPRSPTDGGFADREQVRRASAARATSVVG
jgi:hypothetical protein